MKRGQSGRRPGVLPRRVAAVATVICTSFSGGVLAEVDARSKADVRAEGEERSLPRVDVVGNAQSTSLAPGSAAVIDVRTMEESRLFNVNEALRKVPGVHVREEEGVGLRPNIGIRGLNPTRSTKTLLLEDGLPLSFAPYGDNASYYHPPIDRYESIEVSKGSQVIRFGPQTAGGVINYITPEPQRELGGFIGLAAGSRGYLNSHVTVTGNGVIADIYHKQSDGARDNMHSRLDDLNFKWAGQLNDDHKLVLRATHFREDSQLTYSGLTQAEYTNLGPRYNPFKNDFFDANRTGLSATHEWRLNADSKVLTSIYGAYFDRDWWRQGSDTGTAASALNCQGQTGQSRLSGTALTDAQLNACKMEGRLRSYTTAGIDSRVQLRHQAFGIDNQLEAGVKFQHEVQRRRQQNYASYTSYLAGSGMTIGEDQKRRTEATSAFVSNRFAVNDRFAVTPIARVEMIRHARTNYVNNRSGSDSFVEFIPGVGATYQLSASSLVYGGVHRGFSPPRVEDAINTSGTSIELNAEKSINAELGIRAEPAKNLFVDAALFQNDFSNLVQVGSIAGGSTTYSEGKALFRGVEMAGQVDNLTQAIDGNVFVRLSWTYLPTAEQRSSFMNPTSTTPVVNQVGKRLPYAPEHLLTMSLGYRAPTNWNTRVEYVYVGEQYTDFANTRTADPAGNGQAGLIDAYGIWNAVANYTVGKATFFIAAKNLGDRTYIVDRTRGIQVGMPRTFQAGLKYAF